MNKECKDKKKRVKKQQFKKLKRPQMIKNTKRLKR